LIPKSKFLKQRCDANLRSKLTDKSKIAANGRHRQMSRTFPITSIQPGLRIHGAASHKLCAGAKQAPNLRRTDSKDLAKSAVCQNASEYRRFVGTPC